MKKTIGLFTLVILFIHPIYINGDWFSDRRDAVTTPIKEGYDYEKNKIKEGYDYEKNKIKRGYNYEKNKIKRGYDYEKNKIKNKSQATYDKVEQQSRETINNIRRGAEYESQKAYQNTQGSIRKLEEFNRNNRIDSNQLNSAVKEAQQITSSAVRKTFGTSVPSIRIKKTIPRIRIKYPPKIKETLNKWGKRMSSDKISKGIKNTIDYWESSESGKALHEAGKKVSVGNIAKGTQNTIDYLESSELGKSLHEAGKKVSVGNIAKGTQNTIDYWESSELGKSLHEAGGKANDYIDVRVTDTHKKINVALEADSFSEWLGMKVLGGQAIKHRRAAELRQYGEAHKCERIKMYKKLGYSSQKAAILNYFLYGDDCENIRDLWAVDSFISFFASEFNKSLKVRIELGQRLDSKELEGLFSSTFDNTYREFDFSQVTSKMSFMLSNIGGDESFRSSEEGATDTIMLPIFQTSKTTFLISPHYDAFGNFSSPF